MNNERSQYFGVRRHTVLTYMRVMENLCRNCSRRCIAKEKLECVDFALKKARQSADGAGNK